jgi:hypothetical protein
MTDHRWGKRRLDGFGFVGLFVLGLSRASATPLCGVSASAVDSLQVASSAASVDGKVTLNDESGLPGATVTLTRQAETKAITGESDRAGHFILQGVSPGTFVLTVSYPGFEPFVSPEFELVTGEPCHFPVIKLSIHTAYQLDVVATQEEVAKEEVNALEKQRVLGILPNFYTSYVAHPAPLSSKQKYGLALHDVGDAGTFLSAAAVAGVEQAENMFPGYGQGAQGYAKRFGAATADSAISRMLGSAVLPAALHQDPRYFYKGTGSKRSRFFYALSMTVICKGDNGRFQPNYSHIGGSFASGAISNLYHAPADRGIGLTMIQTLLDFTGRASNNVIQELLLRRVTTNAPPQTKP